MNLILHGYGSGSSSSFALNSTAGAHQQIILTFNGTPAVSSSALIPSNWIVTGGSHPVTVTGISIIGQTVTLSTTIQTGGTAYTLTIPNTISDAVTGDLYLGSPTVNFTGVATPPPVFATAISDNLVQVVWGRDVVESEATDPTKYSLDNGASVIAASAIDSVTYRLTTSTLTPSTTYTLTTSVHDVYGNT